MYAMTFRPGVWENAWKLGWDPKIPPKPPMLGLCMISWGTQRERSKAHCGALCGLLGGLGPRHADGVGACRRESSCGHSVNSLSLGGEMEVPCREKPVLVIWENKERTLVGKGLARSLTSKLPEADILLRPLPR